MTCASRLGGIAAAFALSSLAPLSGARAAEERKVEPAAPLASFLTADDYPSAAIRMGEQGTVSFRLSVDAAGRVSACDVLSTSGSETLDSTTCRLMTMRTRFRPATDSSGRPVAGSYEGRIIWRLPAGGPGRIDLPHRPSVAIGLWSACSDGEAAKLALSDLDAPRIAERAFAACAALEQRIVREIAQAKVEVDTQRFVQAIKDDFTARLGPRLEQVRSELGPQSK